MFGGDVDAVFQSSDPNVVADRLESWRDEFNRQVQGFDKVQRAAAELRVTETAVNGGLAVTVDVSGQVVDIQTNDELETIGTKDIGPAVLACIRRAQQALAAKFAETAKETLGDDDPLGTQLSEQFRERFPESREEPGPRRRPRAEEGAPNVWDED
jgi:DNA-binding protein YbaB